MSQQQEVEKGAEAICKCIHNALQTDQGALIGRNGSIELNVLLDTTLSQEDYRLQILETNAGIFHSRPDSFASFLKWRQQTYMAILNSDVLATGWYAPLAEAETRTFNSWNLRAQRVPLRSLEPYYVEQSRDNQWIQYLKGQKVAVITSFTDSAEHQVKQDLTKIWEYRLTWPSGIEWAWIQTGHPPSVAKGSNEWPSGVNSWLDAVDLMVEKVIWSGARFALIGCGGLGMIIASKLKDRGIIAIVLGGAIQVLFGIKGRRWETHSVIGKFWNDKWIWPSLKETPGNAQTIEGGCYWAKQ